MKTRCEVVPVESLGASLTEAMWRRFDRHYTGVTREVFENDLRRKQQALVLWRGDQLVGFTSQAFQTVNSHRVVYSGDVIIAPEARDVGTAYFFHRWATAVWKRCDWWCALSAGPRTFRILHTFYKRVTPNQEGDESEEERALRHQFAKHAYGECYDRSTGIVKLSHPYMQRAKDQQIRGDYPMDLYFRQSNPCWRQGDELVSLISLRPENWKPVAMRMLHWKGGDA